MMTELDQATEKAHALYYAIYKPRSYDVPEEPKGWFENLASFLGMGMRYDPSISKIFPTFEEFMILSDLKSLQVMQKKVALDIPLDDLDRHTISKYTPTTT